VNCDGEREPHSLACQEHASEWKRHQAYKSKTTINGIRRIIQRPTDIQPWQHNRAQRLHQPHDEEQVIHGLHHYFSPSKFYCVETICTPCGVVLAWTLFDKSESPTQILNWLDTIVYPNKEDRPAYICIDKACLVSSIFFNWTWS
jgi:hypothetical protein